MSSWKKQPLMDLIDLIGGGTPKTSVLEYWDGEIPWISVKDFNNDNRYVYKTEKRISKLGLENSSTKMLQKDDIIISARGTVGEIAMIPYPMAFNQSCYGIRGKNGINQIFLYYLIKDRVKNLKSLTHGSVFDTITRDTFNNIEVTIPERSKQDSIAKILSIFDDMIELNRRINDNLEQQLQCHFLNFADSSDKAVMLSDICELTSSKRVFAKDYRSTGIPFYRGKEISLRSNGQTITDLLYITQDHFETLKKQSGVPQFGDILITAVGTIGNCYMVQNEEFYFKDGNIIWIKNFSSPEINYYVYDYMQSVQFINDLSTITIGSTQQALTIISLSKLKINLPNHEQLITYYSFSKMAHDTIANNQAENNVLIKLRDTLLPQLMSGKLDVSEV